MIDRSKAAITDLGRFLNAVRAIFDTWTLPDANWYPTLWFRGHGDADWALMPGWQRIGTSSKGLGEDWYNEGTLLRDFSLRAPRYLHAVPSNSWEWSFLMQHYGLPTRLLDWSESALIGLYFALRDNKGTCDAAVWVLNPWWLNKQSLGKYEIPSAGDPLLADWAPRWEGHIKGVLPVAIKPVHATVRISVQRGFFTIHGTERHALERLSRRRREDRPQLIKLTIPKQFVEEMKRDLSIAGITETVIFPELDGLCREIKGGFFGS
ncbi:MAG: FRG domain-containing protein [Nitrospira sp.]|nr:FRG domain-containing protein [Nitrospira sp.]